jgi:molecular chaperone GrpE
MTDPTARQAETAGAETEQSLEKPAPAAEDPVALAQREAAEYKDKVLRTLAEMENLRRRTEREVSDARTYGIAGFARDVLAIADNMQRALDAIAPHVRESADANMKAFIEGVELTERELLKTLEKNGVKKFTPEGEKFDPNVHQAMYEIENSDLPPGHVGQVIQAGYMLGERILRPALVGVVKATAKQQQAANGNPKNG